VGAITQSSQAVGRAKRINGLNFGALLASRPGEEQTEGIGSSTEGQRAGNSLIGRINQRPCVRLAQKHITAKAGEVFGMGGWVPDLEGSRWRVG